MRAKRLLDCPQMALMKNYQNRLRAITILIVQIVGNVLAQYGRPREISEIKAHANIVTC